MLDGKTKDMVGADDEGELVQPGKPLPEPCEPSAKERASHNLTHLPYRGWCEHCVSARRPNPHHGAKSPSSQRTIPLLVADYCHVRDNQLRSWPPFWSPDCTSRKLFWRLIVTKRKWMIMSLLDWPLSCEILATPRSCTGQTKRAPYAPCLNRHSEDLVDIVNVTIHG